MAAIPKTVSAIAFAALALTALVAIFNSSNPSAPTSSAPTLSTTSSAPKPTPTSSLAASASCTDEAPPSGWKFNTCDLLKDNGKCDKKWAADYCDATCGRCTVLPRLTVKGTKIYDHNGDEWVGKGMNWGRHSVLTLYDENDVARMREALKSSDGTPWINHVRIVFKWIRGTNEKIKSYDAYADDPHNGYMKESIRTYIDNMVQWATSEKIWVTLTMTYNGGVDNYKDACSPFVTNSTWRDEHQKMWQYLVDKYKDTPYMAWVEPWSEAKMDACTSEQATEWSNELIAKIHEKEAGLPVALGTHYNQCSAPSHWHKLDSDQIILPINFWCPSATSESGYGVETTCQTAWGGKGAPVRPCIPGCTDAEAGVKGNKAMTTPSKGDYEVMLQSALAKGKELNYPIWADQWGCDDSQPGCVSWIEDMGKMLKEHKVSTDWWSWKGDCAKCVLAPAIDCADWKSHKSEYTSGSDCKTNSALMVINPTLADALNNALGD